jgi:hypothetical protein
MIPLYAPRCTERSRAMGVSFKGAHFPKEMMQTGVRW